MYVPININENPGLTFQGLGFGGGGGEGGEVLFNAAGHCFLSCKIGICK